VRVEISITYYLPAQCRSPIFFHPGLPFPAARLTAPLSGRSAVMPSRVENKPLKEGVPAARLKSIDCHRGKGWLGFWGIPDK
jgi:hypothetical protein